jgi:glycosyltransferase involved in cell wall biosynthesis
MLLIDIRLFGDYMISVVIPIGHWEFYVARSVSSVLAQGPVLGEIILVDNTKDDMFKEYLKPTLDDSRIIILRSDKDLDTAHARNLGIDKASYEYIAVLDSDDEYLPGHLKRAIDELEQSASDFYCCSYLNVYKGERHVIEPSEQFLSTRDLIIYTSIGHSTVVYRKRLQFRYPEIGRRHDYAAWLGLAKNNVSFISNRSQGVIRYKRDGSLSSGSRWLLFAKQTWVTLRFSGLNFFVASYYQLFFVILKTIKIMRIR